MGTRYRAEVEAAYRKLEAATAGPDGRTPFSRGALTGYRWALGRADAAPVTGGTDAGAPDLGLLTAEVDAVAVQLEDTAQRDVPDDHARGVYEALAWICGQSDLRP
ncbi:hypothetical protein OG204_30135 [Streptomyces sp. NBC_01387]|uniref:hypothetical protein n=1 Tax=unclassified Streptomyces TaxID=2593676 RepID=UPI0020243238|nr:MULTISPECIES: hypothetical protein [unclassified Streptomyces]MCX4547375.1 hypothetical protein [Streptomyces sp. NBC_01500]WSC19099.1 hypothetical protein OIE60_05140 [Streptomyces sp. NBC_01766]WSV53123.1 hypothetical protein OG282_05090 [Streptomyces sp. NBC_01014]